MSREQIRQNKGEIYFSNIYSIPWYQGIANPESEFHRRPSQIRQLTAQLQDEHACAEQEGSLFNAILMACASWRSRSALS